MRGKGERITCEMLWEEESRDSSRSRNKLLRVLTTVRTPDALLYGTVFRKKASDILIILRQTMAYYRCTLLQYRTRAVQNKIIVQNYHTVPIPFILYL